MDVLEASDDLPAQKEAITPSTRLVTIRGAHRLVLICQASRLLGSSVDDRLEHSGRQAPRGSISPEPGGHGGSGGSTPPLS